jgi:two-component system, NtrC family, sensor kinase
MNPIRALVMQRRWRLAALALWSVGVGGSLWLSLADIHRQNHEVAIEGARNMFHMVVLTRAWNADHGGVYVPVTEKTQPNPYLKHPEREITAQDGTQYTLVNPAFMTRQIAEMAQGKSDVVFHITSLDPIRPANAADPWESEALRAFEAGAEEQQGFEERDGAPFLRYMAPLMVTQGCMKCHEEQGYLVGDVRGGISVTQRYDNFLKAAVPRERLTIALHLLVFMILSGVSWWLLGQLQRGWLALEHKIEELETTRGHLLQSEKMASLGRMVAGFAHEINTPVGVAVGAVSHTESTLDSIDRLLQSEEVSEQELVRHLGELRQGSQLALSNLRRAANLVQRFKRSSVDQSSEQRRLFEMQELIDDVRYALTNHLKRLPIKLEIDCPPGLRVFGAPGMLEQVLTNLILNSLVHGFGDGERPGTIRLQVDTPSPGRLRLRYGDDGVGMPSQVAERIFEPFFTTKRGAGGSGLGMYLSYNLVTAQLGGTIQCESHPGEGVLFTIEIPFTSIPCGDEEAHS